MASSVRKSPTPFTQAEVVLLPSLKNCLLNLPSSLVAILLNANAVVQNVVVELNIRQPSPNGAVPKGRINSSHKSVFLGWTGMQSQTRGNPLGNAGRQDPDSPLVEVDTTFGRLLGITDGTKVCSP